jgi:acyl carrier protein
LKKAIWNAIVGNHPVSSAQSTNTIFRSDTKPKVQACVPCNKIQPLTDSKQQLFPIVLRIIADVAHIDLSELIESASLSDLGIDQLQFISITSKIRDLMSLEIPTSMFSNKTTIAGLKAYFNRELGLQKMELMSDPILSSGVSAAKSYTQTPLSNDEGDVENMADQFLAAVRAETGVHPHEIEPWSLFSDMGVDSLMSIAIIDSMRKKTGLVLPASFFADHPTVADMRTEFGKVAEPMNPSLPITAALQTLTSKTSIKIGAISAAIPKSPVAKQFDSTSTSSVAIQKSLPEIEPVGHQSLRRTRPKILQQCCPAPRSPIIKPYASILNYGWSRICNRLHTSSFLSYRPSCLCTRVSIPSFPT